MSGTDQPTSDDAARDQRTKAEIQSDLEQTREHLAETVDALSHKLDVKTRTRETASTVRREHGRELTVGAAVTTVVVVGLILWRRRRR